MSDSSDPQRPGSPPPGQQQPQPSHPGCAEAREQAAVALLTRTDPPPGVLAHLDACPPCRDEYLELADLPALLGAVGGVDAGIGAGPGSPRSQVAAAVAAASPHLLGRLMTEVARHRRRRRLVTAMATAAAVLAIAIPAARLLDQGDAEPGSTVAGAPVTSSAGTSSGPSEGTFGGAFAGSGTDPVTGAGADISIDAQGAGSSVTVAVRGLPSGTHCRMLVHDASGHALPAGGWVIQPRYDEPYVELVQVAPASIRSVELQDDRTGRRIVDVPIRQA